MDHIHSASVDVNRLPIDAVIWVETEKFAYKLEVITPEVSAVQIETGDPLVGDGLFGRVTNVIGHMQRLVFKIGDFTRATAPVTSVTVSGEGWEYKVF
jgi:hypothetical protein